MDKIPFDPYDFFGYLASGLVVLVGMDLTFGFPNILGQELGAVESFILLLTVYVTGQIVATPAKGLFEDLVVGLLLKRPSINLFRPIPPKILRWIFPRYFAPLPELTRTRILSRASAGGVPETGEGLFLHVRYNPAIRGDEKLMKRLDSFRDKYGFNRNLSFSSLSVGIALTIEARLDSVTDSSPEKYGLAALAVGIFLFYRYLKFFRQYSYELFNAYGRLTQTADGARS